MLPVNHSTPGLRNTWSAKSGLRTLNSISFRLKEQTNLKEKVESCQLEPMMNQCFI